MNTTSASRADHWATPSSPRVHRRVLVWDAPVRVFHWLMVLSFAGAWLSAESERFRLLHVTLSYTMAGLVAFRIVWGLVGSHHARFANFVRGPAAVARYLGALLRGRPEHHTGHNPAGALAIVAMLLLAAAVTASGWAGFEGGYGEWVKDLHEAVAGTMLGFVGVHVAGVALASWMHRENLVGAMLSGRKAAPHADGIRGAWRSVAALMVVAVCGFWWLQWQTAPTGGVADRPAASAKAHHDGDRD
jgi:cytochrome b